MEREWQHGNDHLAPGAVLRLWEWQGTGRWYAALCGLDLWVEAGSADDAMGALSAQVRERGPEWSAHADGIDDVRARLRQEET